ncbi:type I site specific restriction modification protein [Caudoviricetes sp.]|nr:type I site specific restriction modification protein [Caudoviricetes sp.]
MKELRYYQQEAVEQLLIGLDDRQKKPYASIMTALGKSVILAEVAKAYLNQGARALQLAQTRELIKQNEAATNAQTGIKSGVYCKQLGMTQLKQQSIIAMPSSFVGVRNLESFDVVLIDECHHVSNDVNTTYRKIFDAQLKKNPHVKFAGVTATPYRLGQGMLHQSCLKGERFFTDLVYDTAAHPGVARLVNEGYLAPIKTLNSLCHVDLSGVRMSGNDYNRQDVGKKFAIVANDIADDIQQHIINDGIETFLIFASTIENAYALADRWQNPHEIRVLHGNSHTRTEDIKWLKNGSGRRGIINVMLLTEGFDMPWLDYVAIACSTTSPGKMVQMVGRVVRPYGDKIGMVSDYGTNFERLGSIDNVVPPKNKKELREAAQKSCLSCWTLNRLSAKFCSSCGAEFMPTEDGNYKMRSKEEALKAKRMEKLDKMQVESVDWYIEKEWHGTKIAGYFNEPHIPYSRIENHKKFIFNFEAGAADYAKSYAFFKHLMKDENDWNDLVKEGLTNENVVQLLNAVPEFFKKIFCIFTEKVGKYENIVQIETE